MADQKVRELSEQTNPIDGDLVEVTHYTGSVYQSLKMALSTLYTWIITQIQSTYVLTSHTELTLLDGVNQTVTFSMRDLVEKIVVTSMSENATLTVTSVGYIPNKTYIDADSFELVNEINILITSTTANKNKLSFTSSGDIDLTIIYTNIPT